MIKYILIRIVRNFKAKLGQEGPDREDTLDKDAQKILSSLRLAYDRITDGLVDFPKLLDFPELKGEGVIDNYTEFFEEIGQEIGLENVIPNMWVADLFDSNDNDNLQYLEDQLSSYLGI